MLDKIRPAREDINYESLIYNECDENELLEELNLRLSTIITTKCLVTTMKMTRTK